MNKPLLSIVIANYNYGRFLEEAIQSVLAQSCRDFELIVVDGGSTDNSVDVIKKYEDKIAWWVSEKDKGQSDAFNKGFAKANGRYLTWLNADDVMLPGVIEKLKEAARKYPECEWFVGGCFWLDKEMKVIQCRRAAPMSKIRLNAGRVLVWGPSSFFDRRLLELVGGIDERFHYAMDSDLWHRFAYLRNARYKVLCDYAWGLRLHEDAKMSGHNFDPKKKDLNHPRWKQIKQENEWIREHYNPKYKLNWLRTLFSISYFQAFLSRVDSVRYRAVHYSTVVRGW